MEQHKCLGIYWGRDGATAVLAGFDGGTLQLWSCFSVEAAKPVEGQEHRSLAELISEACAQRQLSFNEITVAVDCGMFTQHVVHSEFSTARQIAQTIRYDAEEVLATDASKLALAFNVISSGDSGSSVCVYSADRTAMMDVLAELQNNKFDPTAMEPDVSCLVRFIRYAFSPQPQSHPLYVMLGRVYGYFAAAAGEDGNWPVRTFLIGAGQNRESLVSNQIPMTLAMLNTAEPADSLRIFDSTNTVTAEKIGKIVSLAAEPLNMTKIMEPVAAGMAESPDPVDFAIACGAALGHITKTRTDFRQDFMPYQGKKMLFEKTLKALAISMTMMLLAVGLYFQLRLFKANSYLSDLRQTLRAEYAAATGKKPDHGQTALSMLNKLKVEQNRIEKIKSGQLSASGEASVSALLTYFMEALNNAPQTVHPNIDFITVGSKSIVVAGDTANREATLTLLRAIDANPHLKVSRSTYDFKSGRDQFNITIVPKESAKK